MSEVHIDTGVTGEKRQSWSRANPRAVLERIVRENPNATETEIADLCWEEFTVGVTFDGNHALRSREFLETIVTEYWVHNNYARLVVPDDEVKQRRAAARQSVRRVVTAINDAIEERVKIALLDMILPTGKPVRSSSREELIDLGGWVSRVAERLQPNQTIEEAGITEAQLRELYAP
jgi:hypothetical protein